MKRLFVLLIAVVLFNACNDKGKPNPPPVHLSMKYTELNNVSVKFGQFKKLDIDGDKTSDLLFSTVLVGDPLFGRDKRKYFVSGAFDVFSLVDGQEETPVLNKNDVITIDNHPGYNWYNASSLVLAEKIIEETVPEHWEGNWKNAHHNFFPVQVRKGDRRYNGWVELSFKMDTEELVLHRAALAVVAGKNIKAGQ